MVLTPFSEGAFNNQLVKVLTENVEVQERLLEQLTAEVRRRGFAGVNIDFEYVLPENKVQYAAFIGKMRELLRPEGYTVSVAVPPKVSDEQSGSPWRWPQKPPSTSRGCSTRASITGCWARRRTR